MGQLKKLIPKERRNKIFDAFDKRLPEESFVREQFANGISTVGAGLVIAGAVLDSKGYPRTGMALRGIGETTDDIDGDTARRLGTDGRIGALVDATLDKVKVATEVVTLWRTATRIASPENESRRTKLAVIGGKHLANAALNTCIAAKGEEAKSSEAGKINMWMDGLAIGFWGISDVVKNPIARATTNTLGNVAFAGGLATGVVSTYGYVQQAIEAGNASINDNPAEIMPTMSMYDEQAALANPQLAP